MAFVLVKLVFVEGVKSFHNRYRASTAFINAGLYPAMIFLSLVAANEAQFRFVDSGYDESSGVYIYTKGGEYNVSSYDLAVCSEKAGVWGLYWELDKEPLCKLFPADDVAKITGKSESYTLTSRQTLFPTYSNLVIQIDYELKTGKKGSGWVDVDELVRAN